MTAHILPHNYEMVRQISTSSTAHVYLVRSKLDGVELTAKCISLLDVPKELSISLKLAHRIGIELHHNNILHALKPPMDVGEHIMMQITPYYEKRDLDGYIKKYKSSNELIPEADVWRAAMCLTSAVAYLQSSHAKDNSSLKPIVHRNIQPSNILISNDGNYILTGFSNCTEMQESGLNAPDTSDGIFRSRKITYMAPEIIANKPWDGRIDVWGIGCTLYEMCTGMKYVEAVTPKFALKEIATSVIPQRLLGYSVELTELISSLLAADFHKRPQISDLLSDERIKSYM